MALLRCPQCHEIVGDDPAAKPVNDDGTVDDEYLCLDCVEDNLQGYDDDAA